MMSFLEIIAMRIERNVLAITGRINLVKTILVILTKEACDKTLEEKVSLEKTMVEL